MSFHRSSVHSYDVAPEGAKAGLRQTELSLAVMRQFGCTRANLDHAAALARINGTDLGGELVAGRLVHEDALFEAVAAVLDLPFSRTIAPGTTVIGASDDGSRHVRVCGPDLAPTLYLAPAIEQLDVCREFLARRGEKGPRVVVTTARAIRALRDEQTTAQRSSSARLAFSADDPRWSARHVLTSSQGFLAGLLLSASAVLLATQGYGALTALHLIMSLFFAAHTTLRLLVLLQHDRQTPRTRRAAAVTGQATLPIYSVLVALHHETDMVDPLVASLAALDWPRSRLDVKLICEADDAATIAAVRRAIADEPGFGLVLVPPSEPRTKPKALNFALPLTRGDFVVLYDAEDRPDPGQLMEAWRRFSEGDQRLACLQAPLTIRNHGVNFFTGLFALEYAVLFRATLPFLARHQLPLPLGGTSNHFRRAALCAVGAWDSHNVAEDADLGVRLARHGYHTGTIDAATCEVAPTRWRDWRNQRTRWIKGWIQTWLVHMRHPRRLLRDLGFLNFVSFQVLFVGMIAGSLMHSLFALHLVLGLIQMALGTAPRFAIHWLVFVDVFNVVVAWLAFALLATRVTIGSERNLLSKRLWALWGYWLLVSYAGLRAAYQLVRSPHLWEKTPHTEDVVDGRPYTPVALPAE